MSESADIPGQNLNDRIKLNVGGKLFETTLSTVRSGGTDSLLYALSNRFISDPNKNLDPIFIDRDPEIFSVLLFLLRSDRLPSTASRFSKQELTDEAYYYGIDAQIKSAMSPPPFDGIDSSVVETIRPAFDGWASTFTAAADDGSLWIAHGGQISSYDWNLTHSETIRTHVDDIDSICRVWPEIAAVGSESDDGLHFYDISGCRHVGSIHWTDPSDPRVYKARVSAIADSADSVFGSFDCPHGENCILMIDKSTLQIVSSFGRQSGNQTKHTVAGKLSWVPETGVIVGSAVMCGAFGYSGYIRMWDPRSGNVVWDTNEPGSGRSSRFGDSFAAVDVDDEELKLFKVCSKSGDLGMADMRKLSEDPWIYLKDKNPSLGNLGGGTDLGAGSFVLHCYKRQALVGRDGSLEVWSQVKESKDGLDIEREVTANLYRRNFVDKVSDSERGTIKKIEGGGNRLFVSRENVEGVEVWESSYSSRATNHTL